MKNVFLSYAHKDQDKANTISEALKRHGVNTQLDASQVATGADFAASVTGAIEASDVFLVLLSEASGDSEFVMTEAQEAISGKKRVVPVQLDGAAKNNFIWPLLSDRQGFVVAPDQPLEEAAEKIAGSIASLADEDEEQETQTLGKSSLF